MKVLKILAAVVLAYVALVVVFESLIGFFQPEAGATLVITTFDSDGSTHERVVSRLESSGQLYVAANHWPRAWYRRTLDDPAVRARIDGVEADYRAVTVTGEERERVEQEHALPLAFRFVTGFPPRHIVRLDPRAS